MTTSERWTVIATIVGIAGVLVGIAGFWIGCQQAHISQLERADNEKVRRLTELEKEQERTANHRVHPEVVALPGGRVIVNLRWLGRNDQIEHVVQVGPTTAEVWRDLQREIGLAPPNLQS
jgi:hypothetical protein